MKNEQKGFCYLEFEGVCIGRLYRTNVVVYRRETQQLELNEGGWSTPSTTKAINTALSRIPLPVRVHRVKGELVKYAV